MSWDRPGTDEQALLVVEAAEEEVEEEDAALGVRVMDMFPIEMSTARSHVLQLLLKVSSVQMTPSTLEFMILTRPCWKKSCSCMDM